MNHIATAVHYSKKYENVLRTHFRIRGFGSFGVCFHALSVRVPKHLHCALKYIKRARNRMLHEIGCDSLHDPKKFVEVINFLEEQLTKVVPNYAPEPLEESMLNGGDTWKEPSTSARLLPFPVLATLQIDHESSRIAA